MKELDNSYLREPHGATKPLSNDAINVGNGLDTIIVSNIRQTKQGGGSVVANSDALEEMPIVPAGTPLCAAEGMIFPAVIRMYEGGSGVSPFFGFGMDADTELNPENVVGILVRTHDFSKEPVCNDGVAVCAHVDAKAYANAIREIYGESVPFGASSYLVNGQIEYSPRRDWFNAPALSLTIEGAEE